MKEVTETCSKALRGGGGSNKGGKIRLRQANSDETKEPRLSLVVSKRVAESLMESGRDREGGRGERERERG